MRKSIFLGLFCSLVFSFQSLASDKAVFNGMENLFSEISKLKERNVLDVGVLAYLGTVEAHKHNPSFYQERLNVLEEVIVKSGKKAEIEADVQLYERHLREFDLSYKPLVDMTDDHILTSRSARRVVDEATINTCIDYLKAFWFLKNLWKNSDQVTKWRAVYLFPKKLYNEKTCPEMGKPGNRRPFVHTALAVEINEEWFVINPEIYPGQTTFDIVELGKNLPQRHEDFDLPSLNNKFFEKYGQFVWGGTTSAKLYERGFYGQYLGNVVISGDVKKNICQ